MINNAYNYDDLKNQVKTELKQAIVEGGQEALAEGLAEVMSKKLSAKKIKFDTKELTEYIQEQISSAINNIDLSKATKKTRGINIAELMGLNPKDLKSKIKELENIVDESAKKLDAKKLLGAVYVAKNRGIDYSEIFSEDDLKDFIKEYKIDADYIKQITEEIANAKPQQSKFFSVFVDSLKELDKVKEKTKDFKDLYDDLIKYMESAPAGTRGNAFWNNIIENYDKLDSKTKALIKTLGQLKTISDGANNQGGLIGDDKTILTRKITDNTTPESVNALKNALDEATKAGVQCARIIDVIDDKQSELFLEIQETAKGSPISSIGGAIDAYNPEVFKATDEQIVKLISDLKKLYELGLEPDVGNLSNVFYDLQKGFTLIDLDLHKEGDKFGFSSFEEILKEFVWALKGSAEDINDIMGSQLDSSLMDKFANKVEKIGEALAEATKQGYAEGQKSNSPSKDFEKLEEDAIEGIKKGADENKDVLENIGTKMAENVKEGFKNAVKQIDLSSVFYEDENTSPDVATSKIKGDKNNIKRYVAGSNDSFNKSVEEIYAERDAADENLQKQIQIVNEKKKELELQKEIKSEIGQAGAEEKETIDITSSIANAIKEVLNETKQVEDVNNNVEDKLKNIRELYEEFEEMAYGGDAVHPADKVEYFERLRTALKSLTEEDLDELDLGEKFSIDKFAAKLENTIEDMKTLSEEVYNLGDNDDWSDEYTVLEGVDEEYKSIYKDIKYICSILEVAKTKNKEAFDAADQSSIVEKKRQEITETKKAIEVKKEEIDATKEVIDTQKKEEISIDQIRDSVKESAQEQINDYERIKQAITETREEIDHLNAQDIVRSKMPKYIDDVYTTKSNKYSQMSNEEFNDKIAEKSKESLATTTREFRVQMTSILAMIDEAKKRGQSLKFDDLISGSPEELKVAKDYFEKIVSYIYSLNDESFVDDVPQKLAKATQKLRDLNIELKKVAENSNDLNFFDYKLNEMIAELSGKRKGINQDEADRLIQLTETLSKLSGKKVSIGDYTDNEKIIAGVSKRLETLRLEQERAAQAAREAALAEKQQAEASEQTTVAIQEQTSAVVQNTEVQEVNTVAKTTGSVPLPNSIKAGFKDESGIVDAVVSDERSSLEGLKNKIFEVRDAIESKTNAFSDELSTVQRVVEDERASLNLLRDKLAEIKGYVEELYKQIGNLGKIDFSGKIKIDGLSTLLSSLKDDKLENKLTAIYAYLDDFAKAVNQIDFKNNLTEELNTILSKGEELKSLASILKSSNKKIKNAGKSHDTKELKEYENAYKDLISTEERYQKLKAKKDSGELLTAKEASDLVKIESTRRRSSEIIEKTTDEIKRQSEAEKEYASYQKETAEAIKASAEAQSKIDAQKNRDILVNSLKNEITAIEKMAANSSKYTKEFRGSLSTEIGAAKNALNGADEEIQDMVTHLKVVKENVPVDALTNTYLTLDKYGLRIQSFLAKNTAMSTEFKEELQKIYDLIQHYKEVGLGDDIGLKDILSDIVKIEEKVTELGETGKSTANKLKDQLSHIWRQDLARFFGLYDIIRYIRQISGEVIKLDTALTELRKVSDASSERLQQSLQKSTDTAKELGSTIEDVIKITADWARLGYNVDEAEELARVTTLFKNVGDNMSAEDASSFMISTLKGFEMEADQAMDIADKFNEVANNFAIDTAGIGDALQRSAAAFNAANTDLNESIALITATNAVVQNPESVGTMWKTVSARIRGAKAELEDMGEDTEGMVESTSKLRDLVKGFTGFDIMEDEKTFKSIYDIILGIGEKWNELNDIDRAALLEALAGKRAGNALAAALNNIDDLKASYETALNASGSAMREQENYEKSIQFSIDRLKATAQDLAQDFMSSDLIKNTIDFFNKVLELLDAIVEKTGDLTPFLTAIGGIFAASKIGKGMGGVADLIGGLTDGQKDKKPISLSGILEWLKQPAFQKAPEVIEKTTEAAAELAETAAEVTAEAAETTTAIEGMAGATGALEGGAAGATISMGALLGIILVVTAAVVAGVAAFNHFNVTVDEVKDQIKETESEIDKLNGEIKELEKIENKTTAQQNRLNLLKKELSVQNQILESRKRLLVLEQTGTKFTDRFDAENFNTKAAIETGNLVEDKSSWSNFWGHFFVGYKDAFEETAEDALKDLNLSTYNYNEFKDQFEAIDSEINSNEFRYYDESRKNQLIESRERALNNLQEAEESLSDSTIIAEAKASELEKVLLQMEEAGVANNNKAYTSIKDIIDRLRESAKAGEKEAGTYDIFSDAEYIDALSNYDVETLKDLINSEKTHNEIVKILNEEYTDLIDVLNQNGYSIDDLIKKYQELTDAEKEAKEAAAVEPLGINDSIDSLSSLADQMGTIDKAFSELYDPDDMEVDLSSIKAIKDAFSEIEGFDLSSIEDELNALYSASSAKEAQNAVDSLASEFLKESKILDRLDESNKDLITSELKRMGIENAEQVVNSNLAISEKEVAINKEFNAHKSKDLINATAEEINEFIEETNRSGEAAQEIYLFALKKQFAAGININNPSDIQYLIDLASNAGIAADACDKLAIAKSRMQAVEAEYTAHKAQEERANRANKNRRTGVTIEIRTPDVVEYEKAAEEAQKYAKEIQNAINNTSVAPTKPIFGGGSATQSAQKAAKDAGSAAKDAAEQFDWLETKIQRCEEEIQRLDKTVSATYKSWSKRNGAIASELDKVREKIALQTTAYEVYMAKANSIALDQHYKDLVMNGGLFIEDIADENLKKLIQDFKQWYEKAIQAKDAIDDLNASLANLAKQKFDNVKSEFEGFTSEIEHFVNMIDKELSHVEAMGKIAGKSFYEEKINKDAEQLEKLKEEREALVNALEEAESNGIEKGSADWIAMRNDIYSVDEKIQELTYDMEELKQKIIEVNKLKFDDIKRQFDGYLSNIQHFRNMIDKEMSHVENMGGIAGKSFYRAEIKQNDKELEALKVERKKLMKQLEEAEKDGLEKGSPEWLEMRDAIYAIDEQIVDVKYETEELKKKMKEVSKLRFDDFKAQFEQVTQIIQNQVNSVNSVISLVEKSGHIVSTKYYENLIKLNKQNISTLHKEYNKLQKQLTKAMEKGDVKKYSNEW